VTAPLQTADAQAWIELCRYADKNDLDWSELSRMVNAILAMKGAQQPAEQPFITAIIDDRRAAYALDQSCTPAFLHWLDTMARREGVAANEAWNAGVAWAQGAQQAPDDPMDWPLPCDVTVGGGTMRKGVKLSTLVLRMKSLYKAATGFDADEVANRTTEERQALADAFMTKIATPLQAPALQPEPQTTGWPPSELMQDDHSGLSKALSNTPHARLNAREAAAQIRALTDDRDSWREQASARVADAVQFAAERDAALEHAAEVRAVVLEEAAQCIDKLALRNKIDSKAWTALRGNAAAIRAMKGAV
jgi:hypothetical protein